MQDKIEKLNSLAEVLDRGSNIIITAPQNKTIRIYTYLARWHHPVEGKLTPKQQELKDLLMADSSSVAPSRTIKILLYCGNLREIQESEHVREFVRFGADVRYSPTKHFSLRMTWCGSKLILGVNEIDKRQSHVPLINYAIYYEARESDPLFAVINDVFDRHFEKATQLVWDTEKKQVGVKGKWARFKKNTVAEITPSKVVRDVISHIIAVIIGVVFMALYAHFFSSK